MSEGMHARATELGISKEHHVAGAAGIIAAYVWWGISPLYFKLLSDINAVEIIAHRILWTLFALALIKFLGYGRGVFRRNLFDRRKMGAHILSMLCLITNWLLFVWAVTHGKILETSLGYFTNPLLSILVGVLFLHERLRPLQILAVACAAVGVLQMVLRLGELPWIALALAVTWCVYGVLRKHAEVDAINGLALELAIAVPMAIGYLAWKAGTGTIEFSLSHPVQATLLATAGPVTMVPLLLFGFAAPRLSLTAIGILQYISPSLSFAIAIFLFHEPFDHVKLAAFTCIWVGLVLYTADALRASHGREAMFQEAVTLD